LPPPVDTNTARQPQQRVLFELPPSLGNAVPNLPPAEERAVRDLSDVMFSVGTTSVGVIRGKVFEDLAGDGKPGPNKRSLAGQWVYLDLNNNGQYDEGEPATTTNNKGEYEFRELRFNRYVVRQMLLSDVIQTAPPDNAAHEVELTEESRAATDRDFGA